VQLGKATCIVRKNKHMQCMTWITGSCVLLSSVCAAGILVKLLNSMSKQIYEQPSYICTFSAAALVYSVWSTVPGTAVSLYAILMTVNNNHNNSLCHTDFVQIFRDVYSIHIYTVSQKYTLLLIITSHRLM